MCADGGAKVFLGQQLVMEMAMKIFAELGAVMGVAEHFSVLAGRVQRVAEVQEVLDELVRSFGPVASPAESQFWWKCAEPAGVGVLQEKDCPAAERIGDTHPDLLYPLPLVDKELRRAHKPGAPGWRDAILLHPKSERGMYLPLAVPGATDHSPPSLNRGGAAATGP